MSDATTVDRELAAVLITLAPLGDRGLQYVDTKRREFDADAMLNVPWSSGERWLVVCAQALWSGVPQKIDLSYIAGLSGPFFAAVMNGIAAYRGADFHTDWKAALAWQQVDALPMPDTLYDFLLARIAEDEADIQPFAWIQRRVLAECEAKRRIVDLLALADDHQAEVRRTAPTYALVQGAEVARDALLRAVMALAAVYANHPDYRAEWRPL